MNIQFLSAITENSSWVFDGIGTEIVCSIISLVVGGLGGGLLGYKIGVKKKVKQKQRAGDGCRE